MVLLTRLNGAQFAVNADLIERVDDTPDTVVTLVDGRKYVVSEPVDEVIERIVSFRATILVQADAIAHESAKTRHPARRLRAVPEPAADGEPGADEVHLDHGAVAEAAEVAQSVGERADLTGAGAGAGAGATGGASPARVATVVELPVREG